MLPYLSSSVKVCELIPEAAVQAKAMTLFPLCLSEKLVCFNQVQILSPNFDHSIALVDVNLVPEMSSSNCGFGYINTCPVYVVVMPTSSMPSYW